MSFALATLSWHGAPTPVLEVAGRYYRLRDVAPEMLGPYPERGLLSLFANWDAAVDRLSGLVDTLQPLGPGLVLPEPAPADFMTPLQYPGKLMLGGANYYEHMHIDANKPNFRKEDNIPVFFLKPAAGSLVGCGQSVRYPSQSRQLDWEIELAAVIGRRARRLSVADAAGTVAAYAVGLDLSARDLQMNPRHPWGFDLFAGKSFDDSCPLGPKIVPSRFVDPDDLRLTLKVNGELKQNAHTSDMIWSVAELVAAVSQHLTLEPGDVLLTGTPAGVGMTTGTFLSVGDRIKAEIGGLGVLDVEIVADPDADRVAS